MRIYSLLIIFIATSFSLFAQKKTATISGLVVDEQDKPMAKVSVGILGKQAAVSTTNDSGKFSITVPSGKAVALVFSYSGYNQQQTNFYLVNGEEETITIQMVKGSFILQDVVVTNKAERTQTGLIKINPKLALNNPTPLSSIESMIQIFAGSARSELTNQYSIRGGSFDENLIYVNDFEVYRPYLIRNGQQEGLSFINPEMTRSVNFFNGGFQSKYGDKMSSVLDITYKKPDTISGNSGSAYIGLLEQGVHIEGLLAKNKATYNIGFRNRNLKGLLGSQETKGNYVPSSTDFQAYITWQPRTKLLLELLANLGSTKFTLFPEESKQTTSVFSPLYTQNLGLDIYFEGQEKDKYNTNMLGLSATLNLSPRFKLKGMLSRFQNKEQENVDIAGAYLFGDRDFDNTQPTFGLIVNPLGAGVYQNFSRNKLDVQVYTASLKGTLEKDKHFIQFGNSFSIEKISDVLKEWEYQDSAGYALPNRIGPLSLYRSINARSELNIARLQGFIQDNILLGSKFTFNAGVRYNINNLNNEFLISPRLGFSYKPTQWEKKDVIFRASVGIYNQPPFYREMRRPDGSVNTALKSQKSYQVSGGVDYAFQVQGRPFRLNTEAYYKSMHDVVPYDIDNVRVRYFGTNSAKAYAYGIEARLYGELVKDAESWISIGLMNTKENLEGDFYQKYFNAAGEEITGSTKDQVIKDSVKTDIGWLRRPTDRRFNFGVFFQDYLSTNKNFKVSLSIIYGTNLPYNIAGSTKYRNALEIPNYIRTDIGFSALLLDGDRSKRRSHNPLRNFETIWASLEVFNLIDRANTISYALIKDFANNTFTIPNRLTPRLINLKLVARW
ncbi:MAG: carboxypeptidase-like regulatory domain-containing protein [Bacteroidota bacterium]